jgi:FkbM family methyltransferase
VAARESPRRRYLLRRWRQHRPLLAVCRQAPTHLPRLRLRAGEPQLRKPLRKPPAQSGGQRHARSFPLSNCETFAPFHVYDLRPGGALHSLGRPSPLRDGPPLLTTGALAVTIDALVSHHGLPAPDLIKLDVDGIEEQILDGAAAVLASGSLRSILVEVTCRDEGKAALTWAESKLALYGYQLKAKSAWSIELRRLRSANFIFAR